LAVDWVWSAFCLLVGNSAPLVPKKQEKKVNQLLNEDLLVSTS
jgi:hypothetical protein